MISNIDDVYDFIHDWIYFVLNTKFGKDIPIIIGSQNVSTSDNRYIIIHSPPISNIKIGEIQIKKNERVDLGGDNIIRRTTYSNIWEATISLEAVRDQRCLMLLDETIQEDSIVDLFIKNNVALIQMEPQLANNELTGKMFQYRQIQDLMIRYTIERQYDDYYIEKVEYTGIIT